MQTPDAVLADVTPAERLKYENHFAKVKRTGGWVDAKTAKQFFTKAGLPVRAVTCDTARTALQPLLTFSLTPPATMSTSQAQLSAPSAICVCSRTSCLSV
jgi:hypothetical protein